MTNTTEIVRMTRDGVTVRVIEDINVKAFPFRIEIRRPGNTFGKFETVNRVTEMDYAIRQAADVFTHAVFSAQLHGTND
jgi:hypothetical protein